MSVDPEKYVHAIDEVAGYVDMAPPVQELPVNAMRVGLDAPLDASGAVDVLETRSRHLHASHPDVIKDRVRQGKLPASATDS